MTDRGNGLPLRSVAGGAGAIGVVKLSSALAIFLTAPALLDGLGPRGFGLWALAYSIIGFGALLDLGTSAAVTLRVMEGLRAESPGFARGAVRAGGVIYVRLAAMLIVGVVGVWALLPLLGVPHRSRIDGLVLGLSAVVAWLAQRLVATVAPLLEAEGKLLRAQALPGLAFASTPILAWVALRWGGGFRASVLAFAAAGMLSLFLVTAASATRLQGPAEQVDLSGLGTLRRDIQLATVADVINFSTDRLVISVAVGISAVATYELGLRVASIALVLATAPQALLFPVFGRRAASAEFEREVGLAGWLWTVAIGLLVACVIAATPALVHIWLAAPEPDVVRIAVVLTGAFGFHACTGVYTAMMKATGQFGPARRFAVRAATTNLVLTVALAPAFGLGGVVAATAIAFTIPSLVFLGGPVRWSGFGHGPFVAVLAAGSAAAVAVFAARVSIEGDGMVDLGLILLVAGGTYVALVSGGLVVVRWRRRMPGGSS